MKIISKFKDYYDYLQGIYGIDEKYILDRTNFFKLPYQPSNDTEVIIHVGTYMIHGLYIDNNYHYGQSLKLYADESITKSHYEHTKYPVDKFYYIPMSGYNYKRYYHINKEIINLGDKSPTWREKYPILLQQFEDTFIKNPILSEFKLQQILSPEEIWAKLYDWKMQEATKQEPDVPVGDDKIRIVNAGFDLKTSFRNIK